MRNMAGVITKMIHFKGGSSRTPEPTCAQGNDSDTTDTTGGASGPAGLDVQTAHLAKYLTLSDTTCVSVSICNGSVGAIKACRHET